MTDQDQSEQDVPSEDDDSALLLDRRHYLGLGAAAVTAAVGASAVGASGNSTDAADTTTDAVDSTTDTVERSTDVSARSTDTADGYHGITFSRELDAVEDLGLDPNGNDPIDGDVPIGDDTLISFPPGTYLVENTIDPNDVTNWGIRGTSGNRDDVRFVVPERAVMDCFTPSGRNILMENVTFDQGPENHTSIGNQFVVEDGLQIHNVEYAGFNPHMHTGATHSLPVKITDPDGVGVIEEFVHTGPSDFAEDTLYNAIPIWTGAGAEGTLIVRNAHIENGGQHSVYGSKTSGPVIVEGGLFRNCQNTHMRLCGEGTVLRDATIVIDTDNAHPDNQGYYTGSTGIWWESGAFGQKGGLIENCDIVCESSGPNAGLIQVDETAGRMTIRNTRIRNEVDDVPSITCQRPGNSPFGYDAPDAPWDVTIENVSISGSGGEGQIMDIVARDGSTVRNCCFAGGNGDGIRLVDSDDCTIEGVDIDVPGQATVFDNSTASTRNITRSTSCPAPDTDVEAVTGSDPGSRPETELDYLIEIDGSDSFPVDYEFAVDGDLEVVDVDDGDGDGISGSTASGTVYSGSDFYGFSGELTTFEADGDLDLRVDGVLVETALIGARTLEVELAESASADVAWYEFEVSETLDGVDLNDEDAVSGTTASGGVSGGVDVYAFTGELTSFTADAATTVRVDDEVVDVSDGTDSGGDTGSDTGSDSDDGTGSDTGSDSGGPKQLAVELAESATGDVAWYEFEVSETLDGVDLNDEDAVSGTTASGGVSGGADLYSFTGEITSLWASDEVDLLVDGAPVTVPDTEGKTLEIESEDGTAVDYEFAVDGTLRAFGAAGPVADGATSGTVSEGTDTFRFNGDVTSFLEDGDLVVRIDGERVDHEALAAGALPNSIVLDGTSGDAEVSYAFEVSGDLAKDASVSVEEGDDLTGRAVAGSVSDGRDGYRFSGDLVAFDIDGSAEVSFDVRAD